MKYSSEYYKKIDAELHKIGFMKTILNYVKNKIIIILVLIDLIF